MHGTVARALGRSQALLLLVFASRAAAFTFARGAAALCFAAGARHFQFRISALSSVRRAAIARRAASTRRAASAITGEGAISGPPRIAEEDGERARTTSVRRAACLALNAGQEPMSACMY